jgi:hypothetical protein
MLDMFFVYIVSAIIFSLFLEMIAIFLLGKTEIEDHAVKVLIRVFMVGLTFPFAIPIVMIDAFIHVVKRRIYYYQRQSAIKVARSTFQKKQGEKKNDWS